MGKLHNKKLYTWDQLEAIYALGVLSLFRGNRTRTAKALGYSLRTFRLRLLRWEVMGYPIPKYMGHIAKEKK
jgi:DNA-binding NtrC family response regulator